MKQSIITAFFFAVVVLGGVYGGAVSSYVLFVAIAAGCLWELTGILFAAGSSHRFFRRFMGLFTGLLPVVMMGARAVWGMDFLHPGQEMSGVETAGWIALAEFFVVLLLIISELFLSDARPFDQIGRYLTGIFYVGFPYMLLMEIAFLNGSYDAHRIFGILWLVWTNDAAAYLIGSQIGRTKLFERISPKKTWEGTIAGVFFTLLMAWLCARFIPSYTFGEWLAVGLAAAVFGSLGDLAESMLKRSVGIKDSGSLFPGHGGFLDRFDAFQFAVPFVWLFVMICRYTAMF